MLAGPLFHFPSEFFIRQRRFAVKFHKKGGTIRENYFSKFVALHRKVWYNKQKKKTRENGDAFSRFFDK